MNFWDEIKRRHVVQVGLIYLAVAWGLTQIADLLLDAFEAPTWVLQVIIGVLAIGFPIMLAVAWIFELRGLSLIPQAKLDDDAAGVVVIPPQPPHEKSIAVLPFVNMSDDESNEYFSDGISEELLNLLAKINDLHVVSRSSAFSFKGKDVPLKEIAAKLNCANVLEGSVRKVGNQVRITAQLIQAETDTHLWSETFDRTLDDIFKVQDDIAATVVEELKAKLFGVMPKVRETDPETYALFLQANHLSNQGTKEADAKSIELCKQVLARDPDYPPAWVCLGRGKAVQTSMGTIPFEEGFADAKQAYEKAIELDPQNAQALANLATNILGMNGNLSEAAELIRRAMIISPRDGMVLRNLGTLLRATGQLDEMITANRLAVQTDPANPTSHLNLAMAYALIKDTERALASGGKALDLSPAMDTLHFVLACGLSMVGEATAALEEIEKEPNEGWQRIGWPLVYHALGQTEQADHAVKELIAEDAEWAAYDIAYVYAFLGQSNEAFEWLYKAVETNDPGLSVILTEPMFESIHDDPRWLPFLRKIGRAPEQLEGVKLNIRLAEGEKLSSDATPRSPGA